MSIVPTVVRAMERIAPLHLAEKWDNVGLLVESPVIRSKAKRILLTIDLTPAVVAEALSTSTSVVISYHPPIFRPLAALTLSNPLQASLLKCAAGGISVFTPHTALDCVKGGINDWLASGFTRLGKATVRAIEPKDNSDEVGSGRILVFQSAIQLENIISSMKTHLGLQSLQLAPVSKTAASSRAIKSVAICAGSGGTLLKDVEADLYFTGEMSHHEVLAAVAKDTNVILCGHDNTERGYLPTLQDELQKVLSKEPEGPFEVVVSTQDHHPLNII